MKKTSLSLTIQKSQYYTHYDIYNVHVTEPHVELVNDRLEKEEFSRSVVIVVDLLWKLMNQFCFDKRQGH